MKMQFPYDVAVASCLGAVITVALALTFGLSPWLWAVIGLIVGPFCYRPSEIVQETVVFGRDFRGALSRGSRNLPECFLKIGVGLQSTVCFIGCVLLGTLSAVVLPLIVFLTVWSMGLSSWDTDIAAVLFVASLIAGLFSGLVASAVLDDMHTKGVQKLWMLPMTQRFFLHHFVKCSDAIDARCHSHSWRGTFFCCAVIPTFLHIQAVTAMPFLIVDGLVTIVLACTTTKRMASMLGTALGAGAASVIALLGVPWAPIFFAVAAPVGWFGGSYLYLLRECLAAAPSTVPVQS